MRKRLFVPGDCLSRILIRNRSRSRSANPQVLLEMHLLLILYFPSLFAEDDVLCPHERSLVVEKALVLSSDEYRGLPISYPPCTFTIRSSSGNDLMGMNSIRFLKVFLTFYITFH
ncbi:hypothetical protein ANCCAN_17149 [Ancylostoma caninum]|uniref:Uncharacterized protein n=1 Tax=Ancylostoma caninum TaxID=29170 RepID=A0A368FZT5_ANCCA|nr:hypothetical protein ANCCAN_17149 [Ancylostoma caninum]